MKSHSLFYRLCTLQMMPKSKEIQPENVWSLFQKDREDHLEELRTLTLDDEIYTREEEPAQGFDDIIYLESVLEGI